MRTLATRGRVPLTTEPDTHGGATRVAITATSGAPVPAGVYLAHLQSGGAQTTVKLTLVD